VRDEELLELLRTAARAVRGAVAESRGLGLSGVRVSQYHADLLADAAALAVLVPGGLRVLSEESDFSGDGTLVCVLDPIDGSTNFDRGIPFYSTSMCVLDEEGPRCALVVNHATDTWYEAVRGSGATRDGEPIAVSAATELAGSIIAFSGLPTSHGGWAQYRALGSASLELCGVADGSLDAYAVVGTARLSPWDYLGGLLVVQEAGGTAGDLGGEQLIQISRARLRPLAASSAQLFEKMRSFSSPRGA
jgi:myo-inositol-1(or 4)-monophosphatase